MDILLMLVTALGCAFIGWAVIYFVSEIPTALNTGRRPFSASALAAVRDSFGAQRKRRRAHRIPINIAELPELLKRPQD